MRMKSFFLAPHTCSDSSVSAALDTNAFSDASVSTAPDMYVGSDASLGRDRTATIRSISKSRLPLKESLLSCDSIANGKGAVRIAEHLRSQRHVYMKKRHADTASYMQKLHKDLQLSNPEFKALHFKDPCHLLNNALEDGIKTSSFNVVHDFVVHFPAMLKSSRELRRKFGLVCLAVGMTIKSLKTVCLSRWFSFYEALEDILDYWRAILSFLRSDEAKGTKRKKLGSLVSSPEAVHDLLVK
ncbi:hypothetical protein HPB49_009103 [Dermacentor silvarum]|uniref:Uncharacterized protein n=1 Tax=Dermacentor silvarum TaxID=543639 RepID=A0ACB8DNL3_DERSI|nr:hypothetical protein HPB49_009103 [Dermacentor silvarum]